MVCQEDSWEYPFPIYDEEERLEQLLNDYRKGAIEYKGTTERDLAIAKTELKGKSEDNVTNEQLRDYFEGLYDYCLGKIVSSVGEEQRVYFRRGEKIQDVLDKLDDRGAGLRKLVGEVLMKRREK